MQRLNYMRRGSGYPLILVHGYLGGSAAWAAQIAAFAGTFDVIAPDLAGFGASSHLDAPDSINGCAQQVLDLLDRLQVDRFHLLGHSMGGMVVQEMAAIAGQRIDRLICYGTGPVGVLPDRFESIDRSRQRLREDGLPATADRIVATWFADGERAPGFQASRDLAYQASMQAALASLAAWETWNGTSALASLGMPTLVLWGDRDRSYGWSQPEALWNGIHNSRLAVVPDCAHSVHMENPRLFNQLIEQFLTGKMRKTTVAADHSEAPAGGLSETHTL